MNDTLVISGIEFNSRLWVGTGKYKDFEETKQAVFKERRRIVQLLVNRIIMHKEWPPEIVFIVDMGDAVSSASNGA